MLKRDPLVFNKPTSQANKGPRREEKSGEALASSPLRSMGGSGNPPDLKKFEEQEQRKETYKLEHLSKELAVPLYKLSAFFPLDLVPDEVIIDLHKITIIHKDFFEVKNINTVSIEDLEEASLESSVLYSTLKIKPREKEVIAVKYLPRNKAEEAHKILDGIVQCNKAGIDLSKIQPEKAKEEILRLGKVAV
jgi:hypothetical protein